MEEVAGTDRVRRVRLQLRCLLPGALSLRDAPLPVEREPELELPEGTPRTLTHERSQPVESVRPVGERGADLRFERAVAREDLPRLLRVALVVQLHRATECHRLAVGPHAEV